MARTERASEIREALLFLVEQHPTDLVNVVSERFGISRQAVAKHIKTLEAERLLQAVGRTRAREYRLVPLSYASLPLAGLSEDEVWDRYFRPYLADVPRNVIELCQYGLTEMVNNAIDHSEGTALEVMLDRLPGRVRMTVFDNGVGIFAKIQRVLGLHDPRQSILELSKGKFTTDPQRHSGQGIFFSSRAFDRFSLMGGGIALLCKYDDLPWAMEASEVLPGTIVRMEISTNSSRTLKELFDRFTTDEDFSFDRTHVPLSLATYGHEFLVSRSQAKRILARFEKFREVLLDFAGVERIGQAFADEIFRVFRADHPMVRLVHINANEEVEQMIRRTEKEREAQLALLK